MSVPHCRAAALVLAMALAPIPWATASAQQVVAVVNGEPITAIDIAQRSRLIELSAHKAPPRQDVLNELIDEKLKLQIAKRYKLEVTDTEVNTAFNSIATRSRTTPQAFTVALARSGISVEALKIRLKADIAWQQIIRGKFQANFQIGEKDVLAALEAEKKDDSTIAFDYTLRPVLLIVPRGSPETVFAPRGGARPRGCATSSRIAMRVCASPAVSRTSRSAIRSYARRPILRCSNGKCSTAPRSAG